MPKARSPLGDVATASAILDRFLHHAEIISFEGDSYRLADCKRLAQASNQAKAPSGSEAAQIAPKKAKAPTESPAENTSNKDSALA